jgi:hypothetical protein
MFTRAKNQHSHMWYGVTRNQSDRTKLLRHFIGVSDRRWGQRHWLAQWADVGAGDEHSCDNYLNYLIGLR